MAKLKKVTASNPVKKERKTTKGRKIKSARYGDSKILQAVKRSGGMVSIAAAKLGCTRKAIYDAMKRNPVINLAVADQRELFLDEAEHALREEVKRREAWAVCFTLKTLGKARGYIERPEFVPVAQQAVLVQNNTVVKEDSAYTQVQKLLASLTQAKIIPPDVLARFSTEGNGADPNASSNGGLAQ